ncbi:MAG: F0F1 ATP synthase subunit A [Polyangiaceae bacterium]|jgi:F-type H+-transporting ATPase subunit a
MPEHTSYFSYLIAMFPALGENMHNLGHSISGKAVGAHAAEPITAALFVALLVILMALAVRGKVVNHEASVIPDDKLTLRTVFEVLIGSFYNLMRDMMGAKRARRYFPIIGTCACFIFFSNLLGLIPGFMSPTGNLNITLGCSTVVFVSFNYYGIKENGLGYFKHLAGPLWWLWWFMFPLELFSMCIRPLTLAVRLMVNMAVDHLLVTVAASMFVLLLPIPIMVLGTLVVVVQTMVFCILSSIYIALATEHEEHDGAHAAAPHAAAH